MSWFTVTEIEADKTNLRIRFCPDHFFHEGEPVTEVALEGVDDPAAIVSGLERFRTDYIVELTVESTELRVLADEGYEETVIPAKAITSRSVEYSMAELKAIALAFERSAREESKRSLQQHSKFIAARHFVAGLIERAEKKRSMSKPPHTVVEAQLDVLRRVLNKLRE